MRGAAIVSSCGQSAAVVGADEGQLSATGANAVGPTVDERGGFPDYPPNEEPLPVSLTLLDLRAAE